MNIITANQTPQQTYPQEGELQAQRLFGTTGTLDQPYPDDVATGAAGVQANAAGGVQPPGAGNQMWPPSQASFGGPTAQLPQQAPIESQQPGAEGQAQPDEFQELWETYSKQGRTLDPRRKERIQKYAQAMGQLMQIKQRGREDKKILGKFFSSMTKRNALLDKLSDDKEKFQALQKGFLVDDLMTGKKVLNAKGQEESLRLRQMQDEWEKISEETRQLGTVLRNRGWDSISANMNPLMIELLTEGFDPDSIMDFSFDDDNQ